MKKKDDGWKQVVFASDCTPCPDCGEPVCPVCKTHYAECNCPGPTQDDEYIYKFRKNVLYAKESTVRVIEIIEAGLAAKGFHGLVLPGTCGCVIGDISPGSCLGDDCEGGYKHTHSQRPSDWLVSPNPDPMTDEAIERCISECC